jgi:hypothetical protein
VRLGATRNRQGPWRFSRAVTGAPRKAGETSHRKVRSQQPCVSFRSLPSYCASRVSSAHVVVPAVVGVQGTEDRGPRRHPRRNVNLSTKSIFLLYYQKRTVWYLPYRQRLLCGHVIQAKGPGSGNCVQGSHCRTGKNNFVFVAFLLTSYTTVLNDVIHRSIAPSPGFHVLVARRFRVPPRRTASYSWFVATQHPAVRFEQTRLESARRTDGRERNMACRFRRGARENRRSCMTMPSGRPNAAVQLCQLVGAVAQHD